MSGAGPRYAVIGAGNGGCAMAAELSLLGREPVLFEHPEFEDRIRPLRDTGGLAVESRTEHFPGGIGTHFARLDRITTDLAAAAQAEIVIVVVPGQHQEALARRMAAHLRPGQLVLLNPGGVGGTLVWARALREAGVEGVLLAQAADLLYAGYRTPEAKVIVGDKKRRAFLGVFPGADRDRVMSMLAPDFPEFEPAANALEAGLQGPGMLVHPLPMLMNAVRIDLEAPFTYDSYDITPSVAAAVEALDQERMAIVAGLGGEVKPIQGILADYYGVTGRTFLEAVLAVPAYQRATAPKDFTHRYIAEEVPTQLVPSREVARLLGVATPVMDATVALASAVTGEDYARTGWTLAKLGLDATDRDALRSALQGGPKSC
ncbi:MAG: NAD/NADP octopine/nopaline dehydrogenase family protein [Acetobacteraceae bacterium]|nr:NAD/NADP octopine/nopaline dehydrogenase family protein [Acetobacteraceae bacterium]